MQLRLLPALCLAATASPLFAVTASFDSLVPSTSVASGYTENGIQFTSPSDFNVASGYYAATLFGGGGYSYSGNALSVTNNGWVGISLPGSLLQSVSFTYGFDWDFNAIENGLMDVSVQWQALLNGNVVDTGGLQFDRDFRSHGGGQITAAPSSNFDQLLIRSTAVAYQGIYAGPGAAWTYQRGDVYGYGDANHIAFDNVNVTAAPARAGSIIAVPDDTSSVVLLGIAAAGTLLAVRVQRRRAASNPDRAS